VITPLADHSSASAAAVHQPHQPNHSPPRHARHRGFPARSAAASSGLVSGPLRPGPAGHRRRTPTARQQKARAASSLRAAPSRRERQQPHVPRQRQTLLPFTTQAVSSRPAASYVLTCLSLHPRRWRRPQVWSSSESRQSRAALFSPYCHAGILLASLEVITSRWSRRRDRVPSEHAFPRPRHWRLPRGLEVADAAMRELCFFTAVSWRLRVWTRIAWSSGAVLHIS